MNYALRCTPLPCIAQQADAFCRTHAGRGVVFQPFSYGVDRRGSPLLYRGRGRRDDELGDAADAFLRLDRSMRSIMPWLSKKGVRRTCPHIAGACRSLDCCRGTEAVPASSEEVDPAEIEEQKPSAARLVVGKRKTKKGKQGK